MAPIRQIAHEVLKTMNPTYKRKPQKQETGIIWGGAMIEKALKPHHCLVHKRLDEMILAPVEAGRNTKNIMAQANKANSADALSRVSAVIYAQVGFFRC